MAHAEKCPVCDGLGKMIHTHPYYTTEREEKPCHGCTGQGWVTVEDRPVIVPSVWDYPVPKDTPTTTTSLSGTLLLDPDTGQLIFKNNHRSTIL